MKNGPWPLTMRLLEAREVIGKVVIVP